MIFLSYEEARKFVRKLNLKGTKEWQAYCKSDTKPDYIPSAPERTYKDKGWIGFGDWLGTGTIANQDRVYLSFKKAREFVRKIGLKNKQAWSEYSKSDKRPSNIPGTPTQTYKKEWKGWGDWLGTGTIANQDRVYLSAKEAKPALQKLHKEHGIKNDKEWKQFAKTHNKLLEKLHLPSNVLDIYSLEKANSEKREKQK